MLGGTGKAISREVRPLARVYKATGLSIQGHWTEYTRPLPSRQKRTFMDWCVPLAVFSCPEQL